MGPSEQDGKFTSGEFLYAIAVNAICGGALIGLAEISRLLLAGLPLVVYGLSLGSVIFVMLGGVTETRKEMRDFVRKEGGEHSLALALCGVLVSAILFGLFCRELFLTGGAEFAGNDGTHRMHWIRFGFDSLFEALFSTSPLSMSCN